MASATLPSRLRAAGPGRRLLSVGLLLLLLLLAWLRYAMTTGASRNSDDASNLLAGADMAAGNWRLHGWIMAPDSYYPTDVLGQAILVRLFGVHPILMPLLEAAIWAAIGLLGTGLALHGQARHHRPGIICLALSLLAFNIFDHGPAETVLSSVASHGSTILLVLASFRLALSPAGAARGLLLWLVAMAGAMADPIYIVTGVLPVLATALLGGVERARRRVVLTEAGLVAGGMLLGRLLLSLSPRIGGFESAHLTITLSSAEALPGHLGFAVWAITRLLGADFFGLVVNHVVIGGAWIRLLRLPLLALFVLVCWEGGVTVLRRCERWPTPAATEHDRLEQMLWFSLALCIASTVMTGAIADPGGIRFFLPAATCGSILVARRFGRLPLGALYGLVLMPVSLLFAILTIPPVSTRSTIARGEETALVDTLRRQGLTHGYAGYWQAAMTTAMSGQRITSLALVQMPDGRLQPFNWFCNRDWYARASGSWRGRVFLVASTTPRNVLDLASEAVVRTFGTPADSVRSGRFEILVYDVDGPMLSRLPPPGG